MIKEEGQPTKSAPRTDMSKNRTIVFSLGTLQIRLCEVMFQRSKLKNENCYKSAHMAFGTPLRCNLMTKEEGERNKSAPRMDMSKNRPIVFSLGTV